MKFPSTFILRIFIIFSLSRASVSCFAEAKEKPLVTIGKETTVITEPLNAAGYPDYVAALDKKYRERVKPERNAFITILRMTGPAEIRWRDKEIDQTKYNEQFYKKLGIEPLPPKGNYLIDSSKYIRELLIEELPTPNTTEEKIEDETERIQAIRDRLLEEEFDVALERPWEVKEFTYVAKWLNQQEPKLKLLEELEGRRDFYAPYVSSGSKSTLVDVPFGHLNSVRIVGRVLQTRANLYLHDGNIEKAWNDCKTLMILANHLYGLPTVIDLLVGKAIEGTATTTLLNNIIHDPHTTTLQLEKIKKEFEAFGNPELSRVLNEGERYSLLSAIINCAEHGFENQTMGTSTKKDKKAPYIPYWDKKLVNFDTLLKNANKDYDRLVEISKISNYIERTEAWEEFDSDIERDKNAIGEKTWKAIGEHLFAEPKVRTEKVSMIFRCLYFPALGAVVKVQAKQQMSRELYRCNFALAKYYKSHKKYPTDFAELKPFGISKLPNDIFTDKPCIYQCDGEGFVLYSVSADQEDSAGYNGTTEDATYHDDISVFSLNRRPIPPQ